MAPSAEQIEVLVKELHGLEIYASCAIAIYFYELVVYGLIKCKKWYKSQSWSVPEVVCLPLEKISSLNYCIITLILLHFTSHTQFSCGLLLLLQQGFFALSTAFQCFMMLIRFRAFYPNRPYVAVSLFIFALMITLFQIINVLGLNEVEVDKIGNNCYVVGDNDFFIIGFTMMMIYSWIIWGFAVIAIYLRKRSYHKRYWRRIFFDDGFMYLSLIAASQAINFIFILDGRDFMSKFINVTPLLVLTSICTQKLILSTRSVNNVEKEKDITFRSFTFVNEKNVVSPQQSFTQSQQQHQSLDTFIDQFYIQEQGYHQQRQTQNIPNIPNQQNQNQQYNYYQQNNQQETNYSQQNQEYLIRIPSPTYSSSTTTSTKVNSMPPSLPPIIVHKQTTSDIEEEEEEEEDNYSSEYDKSSLPRSSNSRSTRGFGSFLLDYFNNLTLTSPTRISHIGMRDSDRIGKISRLSNLKVNTPHLSLNNQLSQGIRKSQQGQQGIIVDPNDIYYFTYSSDDDNEVYLFPAIQIHSDPNNLQERTSISFDDNIRKSNESLTPSTHHQSFAFAGRIIADNNDDNSLVDSIDNKNVVMANDAQDTLSKKHSIEIYMS